MAVHKPTPTLYKLVFCCAKRALFGYIGVWAPNRENADGWGKLCFGYELGV